jgi:hypothetical protein
LKISLSKSQFLILMIVPYTSENGNNKYLKLFNNEIA